MTVLARKNWILISLVAVLMLVMQAMHLSPMFAVDHAIYDASLGGIHKSTGDADKVVIISVSKADLTDNEKTLTLKEGLVNLLTKLRKAGSQSITVLAPLANAHPMLGLDELEQIDAYLNDAKLSGKDKATLSRLVDQARQQMGIDGRLVKEVDQLNRVYFPFHVSADENEDSEFTHAFPLKIEDGGSGSASLIRFLEEPREERTVIYNHTWPMDALLTASRGSGYLSRLVDLDGTVRAVQLVQPYRNELVASLPLLLAAKEYDVSAKDLVITPGESVHIGKRTLAIDNANQIYPSFYVSADNEPVFKQYSYGDIISGKVSLKAFRHKIVLIETPEFLPLEMIQTPIGQVSGTAEMLAHAVTSILNQDVYSRSAMFLWIELMLLIGVALYLILLLPRLSLNSGFFMSLIAVLGLIGTETFLLIGSQSWLHAGPAIIFLVLGYVIVTAQRIFNLQRTKHMQDISHTNRQLGLLLQEQGKLEQAFECFQKLPVNLDNLDLVYNLALDFERKRKFNNAARVFHYIHDRRSDFRDVKHRMKRAEQMEHSTTLGTGQFNSLGSLLDETQGEKPMLGRFVVERELGKGAMGAVYLGRDPKIDRKVAIKTLALAREFESDEIKEVEERFFHEASAAGRLNHPNIVTIYDAAEDHDLAYIAMEYIEGKPLSDFATVKTLLPVPVVLTIIAKTADALEYAGNQGIVHRDIKPANIMYNEATDTVKITDFGIARIASSGRTKTGMILGTPSYMSPEQMSGNHVDTRSDIFSLGVTMFVLLTGHKAFPGDSLAAISYKIVNDKHPDITTIRKDLPEGIKKVIDKALHKNPEKRYQSGIVMKRAILRCLKAMQESKA